MRHRIFYPPHLLLIVLLGWCACPQLRTTDFTVDGIKYLVNSDGQSVTVTYPTDAEPSASNPNTYTGDIVIPESVAYDGSDYKVTAIGKAASVPVKGESDTEARSREFWGGSVIDGQDSGEEETTGLWF